MPSPGLVGLVVLVVGLLAGIALAVAGAIQLARRGLAFKRRLDGYAELPVLKELALAQGRAAIAERALSRLPPLQLRAARALHELTSARDQVRAALLRPSAVTGLVISLLSSDR